MRKQDFPQLRQNITYLDSAATAPKPAAVLDAMRTFAETDYANVHRGIYGIAARATDAYAKARARVAQFVNAGTNETVFTKGATESINLVAASWGRTNLQRGDHILLTALEHHANIVPWQMLAEEKGLIIDVVPLEEDGNITLATFERAVTPQTKLIACAHVSNVLGTVLPVADICKLARSKSIVTLIDGCQAVAHRPVDVKAIGCDFYVFSAHKLYGPSGIGALYGRTELLNAMPPYQGGGDMIEHVTWQKTTFREAPSRFEAGTPPIIEAVGFDAAIDYITGIGFDKIMAHENALLALATKELQKVPGLTIHGTAPGKEPIITFSIAGVQPYDLATLADNFGVCLRVGMHCAEPLHTTLGVPATARVSFALFNEEKDVQQLVAAISKACEMLKCA
ncbi:MAG: aminotransferase class V-fold PLP-dependent enzyme [Bdellovibrionales bacterium]